MKTTNIRERLLGRIPEQWGKWVSCDSGWDWILDDLDRKLSYLDPEYQINQVKEKFGTLRFYYEARTTEDVVFELMDDAVRTAEHYSAYTCEAVENVPCMGLKARELCLIRLPDEKCLVVGLKRYATAVLKELATLP